MKTVLKCVILLQNIHYIFRFTQWVLHKNPTTQSIQSKQFKTSLKLKEPPTQLLTHLLLIRRKYIYIFYKETLFVFIAVDKLVSSHKLPTRLN